MQYAHVQVTGGRGPACRVFSRPWRFLVNIRPLHPMIAALNGYWCGALRRRQSRPYERQRGRRGHTSHFCQRTESAILKSLRLVQICWVLEQQRLVVHEAYVTAWLQSTVGLMQEFAFINLRWLDNLKFKSTVNATANAPKHQFENYLFSGNVPTSLSGQIPFLYYRKTSPQSPRTLSCFFVFSHTTAYMSTVHPTF